MNKLTELLKVEAKEIAASFEKASIEGEGTPQEVSDRREEVVKGFLMKYFPFPYRVVKGNIIDSFGNRSNSIDCIVLNPSHPHTVDPLNGKASIIFADGVDFAIEVKPDLSQKKEIERGLAQIQSVKKLARARTGLARTDLEKERAKRIPSFIFADKTYADIKTLITNIVENYVNNSIPQSEQFDMMIINNRILVFNYGAKTWFQRENFEGIAVLDAGEDALALFLFYMNSLPKSEPEISENILSIYLENMPTGRLYTYTDLNEKLCSIEKA